MKTIYVVGFSAPSDPRDPSNPSDNKMYTDNCPVFATLTFEEAVNSIQKFKANDFTGIKYGYRGTPETSSEWFKQNKDWYLMPMYVNTDNEITTDTWLSIKYVDDALYSIFYIVYETAMNEFDKDVPINRANFGDAFQVNTLCYEGLNNGQNLCDP
jgi:hypothetical protein